MFKKIVISVVVVVALILSLYFYSGAKKDPSKLPPPETASGEASMYMPKKEAKEKLNNNVRVTGPVLVTPDKKEEK